MKPILSLVFLLAALSSPLAVEAQQSQDFGEYVVHYNAFNTNMIPPQVAKGYGIQRSSSRALLNVTVLKKVMSTPGTPVTAKVTASATNLTGQLREVEMREIQDSGGAIYYIGEFPVHNLETYRFDVKVEVEGEPEPFMVRFTHQFFTE
ncbi:MAG: DUF4426 domain-containing protein [Lysobacterales bacterium]|jgi:hypothetical protein